MDINRDCSLEGVPEESLYTKIFFANIDITRTDEGPTKPWAPNSPAVNASGDRSSPPLALRSPCKDRLLRARMGRRLPLVGREARWPIQDKESK